MKAYHDGEGYFCSICGKAGFKSEMALRGHMSIHSKKVRVKKVQVGAAGGGGGGGAGGGEGVKEYIRMVNPLLHDIAERMNRMEKVLTNEIPHKLAVQGERTVLEKVFEVLSHPAILLLFAGMLYLAYREGQRNCECECEGSRVQNKGFGEKVLEKALLKGVDKVLS